MTGAAGTRPAAAPDVEQSWRALMPWITLYSWATLASTAYGVTVAYYFGFVEPTWTNIPTGAAVAAMHLLEVPLVLCAVGVAVFGLRGVTRENRRLYAPLLGFVNVTNFMFLMFEVVQIIDFSVRGGPGIHVLALLSIAGILTSAVVMGVAIWLRVLVLLEREARGTQAA